MSAINGFISFHKTHPKEVVQRMSYRLKHRGPNNEQIWGEDEVAIAQRKLSKKDFIDVAKYPMVSHCGRYVLAMSGAIFNSEKLKQELPNSSKTIHTHEIILNLWSAYGTKTVELLDGVFAFSIWDKLEKSLTLVRDRIGVKPLYWSENENGFFFSSELRGLIASNLIRYDILNSSLVDYLRYQTVQSPDTILSDVKMLAPASILKFHLQKRTISIDKYWNICKLNSPPQIRYAEAKREVKELFFKAVKKNLTTEFSSGAFLSGGIDSSAVVGAMALNSSSPIKTFNISFAEEAYSEAKYARYISKLHNTDHHEIKLSPNHFLELLPNALKDMDHPSGDGPNTWVVSKLTKKAGVDIALSGLGGDELFGGYSIFKRMTKLHHLRWAWQLPVALRNAVGSRLLQTRPSVATSKMAALLALPNYQFNQFYSISRQVLMDEQIRDLLSTHSLPNHLPVEWLNKMGWHKKNGNHLLSRTSVAEISTYLQNVLLRDSDQMGMAHTLELRVPFMDYQLIEFVLSLPDKMKYPTTPKKMLVDSLPKLLPDYIVQRPKMGFSFPWTDWLKTELHSYAFQRIQEISQWEQFNPEAVFSLWDRFQKGDPAITFSRVWPLVVLAEWRRSLIL